MAKHSAMQKELMSRLLTRIALAISDTTASHDPLLQSFAPAVFITIVRNQRAFRLRGTDNDLYISTCDQGRDCCFRHWRTMKSMEDVRENISRPISQMLPSDSRTQHSHLKRLQIVRKLSRSTSRSTMISTVTVSTLYL
jgi:hypothetical protein